ncbi:hypothetical protein CJU73_01305 [Pseudomonas fragi]|uniref:SEC-C metal-binding domain-containing protein n=1 Tax=Pseudomonas fragi TaxID=296 RepID=UPI000BA23EE3|nr:SEC-C metal-binding domain-containing protein [Pseudomonas fragi]PAA31700.1 hypothetical protein CJU73_01305 [Pseudomonas fragi]
MSTGIKVIDCEGGIIRGMKASGLDVAIDLVNSHLIAIDDLKVSGNSISLEQFKRYRNKVSRNALCPCGSGVKIKKCRGFGKCPQVSAQITAPLQSEEQR